VERNIGTTASAMRLVHTLRVAANKGTTDAAIAGLLEAASERIDELEEEINRLEDYIETIDPWAAPKT
jgi:hypothetical protein